jgi:hypothetical protein
LGDVRLALAELADSLQGTFFRDYPLGLEILDFLPEDISFDWYRLMRDAIAPALLTVPYLVYHHELEVHELRRHLEAARLCYLQQLSSCATLRSMGVSGGPAGLLVQELEDRRSSIEGFSRYLAGRLPNLQIYLSARDRAFSLFLEFEVASKEDRRALRAYLDAISAALFELESRFSDS